MANILKKPDFAFIPSSSKESKAYSILPTNGDGDFTFYRNSTTTRVNKDGQLESWPRNLYTNSNNFSSWSYSGTTLVSSTAPAPDGTLTASTINFNVGTGTNQLYINYGVIVPNAITCSIYIRLRSGGTNGSADINIGFYESGFQLKTYTITGNWIRISHTMPTGFADIDDNRTSWLWSSNTYDSLVVDIWGAQLEFGNLTPYLPTTTRLNLPTIDYTDGGPALLLNPERTNLVTHSQDFANAAWTKGSSTVNANKVIAPDGTLTATQLNVTTTTYSGLYITTSATSAIYTVSFFVKKGTKRWFYILNPGANAAKAWFDLELGVLGNVVSGYTATMSSLANGWYRCTITNTVAEAIIYTQCGVSDADSSSTPSSAGYIYIWGAQAELGPNASSYIPTIGATVTRVLEGGTTNFIPKSNRVTVYAEFKLEATGQNVALYGFRPSGAGYTTSNIYYLYFWGGDSNKFGFNTANTDSYGIANSTIANGKYHKVIAVFDYTNFANNELYIDGVKQTLSQVGGTTLQITVKNNFSTLYAQGTTSSAEDPRISYREIYIWDTELTDAECIDLTSQQTSVKNIVNEYKQFVQGSGGVLETENNFAGIIQSLK
jgi:hypothetical protein